MSLLEVRGLVKDYRVPGKAPLHVLRGVSFSVERGERVAIVGRSGGGKSTLLNLLGGLDVPTAGDVLIGGISYYTGFRAAARRNRLRATKIGFVFQSFHLMDELDVLENVMLPTMTGRCRVPGSRRTLRDRARALLAKVGLGDRLGHLPAELSGGEQQRVAVARALMCDPEIIFADEPTGNLDRLTGGDILNLILEADASRRAVVMVTHSPDAAAQCDRIYELSEGVVVPKTR